MIQKLLSNEKDTTRRASFLPVPAFGYGQEIGFEFGLGAIYSFYMDRADTLNRSTNLSGTATYSTKGTYNLSLKSDAWTKGNTYHLIGEVRLREMPFNFYGIGNNTRNIDADRLVQKQFKVLFEGEKMVLKNLYAGFSLGYEDYVFTDREPGGIYTTDIFNEKKGGNVVFMGVSQGYDNRNSNNYTTRGVFGRVTFQLAPDFSSAGGFSGTQTKVDLRGFVSLSSKFVLGMQGYYHGLHGTNTPFYLLPQMGNDELMRGYYTGRFRDNNLLATQAEIRYRYNNRIGAVFFAGFGAVYGKQTLTNT
ncbi:MAG: polymerase, partial [Chitinophagaceae bacterium]